MENVFKRSKCVIATILTLSILLGTSGTCVYAVSEMPEEHTSTVDFVQEQMPVRATSCDDDIDYDYYTANYPIYKSLQGCAGFDSNFIAVGSAFYVQMTNWGLKTYFQSVSPGKWKKGYQNGFCNGEMCSIHFFKNMTTGSDYSGYKLVDGWVE